MAYLYYQAYYLTRWISFSYSLFTDEDGVLVWETITGESGVNVGKSDLVVVAVKGGAPRIRRPTLQTLNLNPGHFSFDPDYPEIPLVSFTWQCREEGEELPSEGEKVTSDPPTSREEYGTGQGHEGGGCWGQGPGMMSNASPNFSISVNLFRTPYITYKIEVATRSKDGRTSGTGVEVSLLTPLDLSAGGRRSACQSTKADSGEWLCCGGEKEDCVVEAGEEAVGEDGCGKVPLNVAGVAGSLIQSLDVMDVAIGLNQRKLALLDDFWVKFGSQFRTFDVQVTATRPGETSEGLALQRIRINEAPVGGTCTAEVMQDIHKDEEEEEEEEGSFEVEVRVGREEPPTLIVTALTEGFEIPKYSFFATTERGEKVTLTFSSKVILPYANLTLWAGVSDQLGAETLYMTAVVIPLLPSQELFNEYQTRKTLLKAVNNKANDEEEEDESSATQEKNKDMLSSVDKFSITSMDEVLQVNNILGSIADPLPKESQEGAVAALKTLAGAADSTAPLAQQKDFAAGALATTASLLTGVNKNVKKGNGTSEKRAEKMVAMARRRLRRSIWNQTEDEEEEEVEEEYLPSEEDEDANKKVESLLGVVGSALGSLLASAVVNLTIASPTSPSLWGSRWLNGESLGDDSSTVQLSLVDAASHPLPVHNATRDFIIHIPRDEGWSVEPEVVEPRVSNTMPLSIHKVEVPLPNLGVSVLVSPSNQSDASHFATGFNESYSFSSFVSSCLFFNKETLSWSSEGCRVVGANTTITTCACNHLTSFGSSFFVAPNAIDFSYVFANAGFLDNLTIYLTLIISLALYFIGLVYARIKDRRDVEKSKVQFLIAGDWEESDVRTLNEAETSRPLLTRGSVDHYLMATSRPLGPLHYLRIWHDNGGKGRSSSWFLGYMVVRDIQTGEQFQFICNQWLAVEEGDGLIDRLVAVAGEEQLRDLSHVFTHSVDKSMADDHLWFSVFLRPPRSRFTRVQRLSSCMALLYLSMLVNAMFYQKVPEDGAGGGLRLGPVSISPQALGIGFISNLIVFPPSFAIVFFFRKSRPRKVKESRLQIALRKQRESAVSQAVWPSSPDVESEGSGNFSYSLDPKPTTLNSTVSLKELIAQQEKDKDKNKVGRRRKLSLPWWFVLVAWFLSASFSPRLSRSTWVMKRPIDEFEDYDDDEEEFHPARDEELLRGPRALGSGVSRRNKNQIGTNLTEEEIAAAKEKRLQEVAMQDLLLEILVYMIFLTLILSVSHVTKDPNNVFLMR
ncbi:hypothetical protein Pmani_005866 [Petrolisthes manimaculis]|uniref:Polycystic kidney disease protein 1-like 2 n=1 Tax=Petrolisthes manimaculis TaxID=1843537 RepID=A0AAE1QAX2_9EUCA|nr:hypothetical protein Pmani_005866 [Petrolisthes manimaculis]